MGLFGKLFEKKTCDLCGGEIGLLGNRKLEDGNCCKACAAKLSPWFSDRRTSTVEEIRQQLEYREKNRSAVEAFTVSRTLGDRYKVLIDEHAGKFVISGFGDFREKNADVLDLSQVTGCNLDIDESRREVFREGRDEEGHLTRESYAPRRYEYSYDFYVTVFVNHPYFDDMRFQLNRGSVEVHAHARHAAQRRIQLEGSPTPPTAEERQNDPDYAKYEQMGLEIKAALTEVREAPPQEAPAASPAAAVTCPWCGAETTPDESGCCEFCGGNVHA